MPSRSMLALLALFSATIVMVMAQQPSGTQSSVASPVPSLSPCISACIQDEAVGDGDDHDDHDDHPKCSSLRVCLFFDEASPDNRFYRTDFQCICTNQHILSEIASCITEHCPPEDQQAALDFQKQQCGAFNGGASGTGASSSAPAATGTGASLTSPTTTGTATGSSGASKSPTVTSAGSAQTSNAAIKVGAAGFGGLVGFVAGIIGAAF